MTTTPNLAPRGLSLDKMGEKPSNLSTGQLSGRSLAVLLGFGLVVYLIGLGDARVLTYHETLFAQPAREMLATGNWVLPNYVGVASYHKPPLTHWSLALAMGLTGSSSEIVIRLPIVLATLALAWQIAVLAARFYGDRVGLLAGLAQLTFFYTLMQGRLAESDMLLALGVTVALSQFALRVLGRPVAERLPWGVNLPFAVATVAAFLAKGPLALIFIGGPVLLFAALCWRNERSLARRTIRFLADPTGLLVGVVGVVAWPLAAYQANPQILANWRMDNLSRFAGGMGGAKPPLFYVWMTPLLLLPWTPWIVATLWQGGRQRAWTKPLPLLAGCWFLVGFSVLSAAVWQHKHYIIPLLPPFSLAAALGLEAWNRRLGLWWQGRQPATCAAASVSPRPLVDLFALVAVVAIGVQCGVMPRFDSYRDQTDFARRLNAALPPGEPLLLAAIPENQIAFYLQRPLVRQDDAHKLITLLRQQSQQGDWEKPVELLGPQWLGEKLRDAGLAVQIMDQCPSIRKIMRPEERLTWLRVQPPALAFRR